MKRVLCVILSVALCLGLNFTAFAGEEAHLPAEPESFAISSVMRSDVENGKVMFAVTGSHLEKRNIYIKLTRNGDYSGIYPVNKQESGWAAFRDSIMGVFGGKNVTALFTSDVPLDSASENSYTVYGAYLAYSEGGAPDPSSSEWRRTDLAIQIPPLNAEIPENNPTIGESGLPEDETPSVPEAPGEDVFEDQVDVEETLPPESSSTPEDNSSTETPSDPSSSDVDEESSSNEMADPSSSEEEPSQPDDSGNVESSIPDLDVLPDDGQSSDDEGEETPPVPGYSEYPDDNESPVPDSDSSSSEPEVEEKTEITDVQSYTLPSPITSKGGSIVVGVIGNKLSDSTLWVKISGNGKDTIAQATKSKSGDSRITDRISIDPNETEQEIPYTVSAMARSDKKRPAADDAEWTEFPGAGIVVPPSTGEDGEDSGDGEFAIQSVQSLTIPSPMSYYGGSVTVTVSGTGLDQAKNMWVMLDDGSREKKIERVRGGSSKTITIPANPSQEKDITYKVSILATDEGGTPGARDRGWERHEEADFIVPAMPADAIPVITGVELEDASANGHAAAIFHVNGENLNAPDTTVWVKAEPKRNRRDAKEVKANSRVTAQTAVTDVVTLPAAEGRDRNSSSGKMASMTVAENLELTSQINVYAAVVRDGEEPKYKLYYVNDPENPQIEKKDPVVTNVRPEGEVVSSDTEFKVFVEGTDLDQLFAEGKAPQLFVKLDDVTDNQEADVMAVVKDGEQYYAVAKLSGLDADTKEYQISVLLDGEQLESPTSSVRVGQRLELVDLQFAEIADDGSCEMTGIIAGAVDGKTIWVKADTGKEQIATYANSEGHFSITLSPISVLESSEVDIWAANISNDKLYNKSSESNSNTTDKNRILGLFGGAGFADSYMMSLVAGEQDTQEDGATSDLDENIPITFPGSTKMGRYSLPFGNSRAAVVPPNGLSVVYDIEYPDSQQTSIDYKGAKAKFTFKSTNWNGWKSKNLMVRIIGSDGAEVVKPVTELIPGDIVDGTDLVREITIPANNGTANLRYRFQYAVSDSSSIESTSDLWKSFENITPGAVPEYIIVPRKPNPNGPLITSVSVRNNDEDGTPGLTPDVEIKVVVEGERLTAENIFIKLLCPQDQSFYMVSQIELQNKGELKGKYAATFDIPENSSSSVMDIEIYSLITGVGLDAAKKIEDGWNLEGTFPLSSVSSDAVKVYELNRPSVNSSGNMVISLRGNNLDLGDIFISVLNTDTQENAIGSDFYPLEQSEITGGTNAYCEIQLLDYSPYVELNYQVNVMATTDGNAPRTLNDFIEYADKTENRTFILSQTIKVSPISALNISAKMYSAPDSSIIISSGDSVNAGDTISVEFDGVLETQTIFAKFVRMGETNLDVSPTPDGGITGNYSGGVANGPNPIFTFTIPTDTSVWKTETFRLYINVVDTPDAENASASWLRREQYIKVNNNGGVLDEVKVGTSSADLESISKYNSNSVPTKAGSIAIQVTPSGSNTVSRVYYFSGNVSSGEAYETTSRNGLYTSPPLKAGVTYKFYADIGGNQVFLFRTVPSSASDTTTDTTNLPVRVIGTDPSSFRAKTAQNVWVVLQVPTVKIPNPAKDYFVRAISKDGAVIAGPVKLSTNGSRASGILAFPDSTAVGKYTLQYDNVETGSYNKLLMLDTNDTAQIVASNEVLPFNPNDEEDPNDPSTSSGSSGSSGSGDSSGSGGNDVPDDKDHLTSNDLKDAIDKADKDSSSQIIIDVADDNVVLTSGFLKDAENNDRDIILRGSNYQWMIPKYSKLRTSNVELLYNLAVLFNSDYESEMKDLVRRDTGSTGEIVPFRIKYHGELPFRMRLTLFTDLPEGRDVWVYRYNEGNHTATLIAETRVDTDGAVRAYMTHCSDYFVSTRRLTSAGTELPDKEWLPYGSDPLRTTNKENPGTGVYPAPWRRKNSLGY